MSFYEVEVEGDFDVLPEEDWPTCEYCDREISDDRLADDDNARYCTDECQADDERDNA